MFKTLTIVGIGVCILASQAMAGNPTQATGTVTMVSSSGLYVRVAPARVALPVSNACASAINTGGVTRATTAVKTGGRVFLVGSGRSTAFATMPVPKVTRVRAAVQPARQAPVGLGTLLARIFGIHPNRS